MKATGIACCAVILALFGWASAAWSAEPAPAAPLAPAAAAAAALPWLNEVPVSLDAAPGSAVLPGVSAPHLLANPSCTCTPSFTTCEQTCIAEGGPRCRPTYHCSGCTATCLCNQSGCF